MDLTKRIGALFRKKEADTKSATIPPARTPATAPPPAPAAVAAVEEEEWVQSIAKMFAHCDENASSKCSGSPPQQVRKALNPFLTLDAQRTHTALQTLGMTWSLAMVTGSMCSGYGECPRCGDAVAPMGKQAGTAQMSCGTCKKPLSVEMMEYAPTVGRQIRDTVVLHAASLRELRHAAQLHEQEDHRGAAAIALRVAASFKSRGHDLAHTDALLRAATYLRPYDRGASHQRAIEALAFLIAGRDISRLVRALYELSVGEYGHDFHLAQTLLRLACDVARSHEPEFEALAYRARALYLQAAFAAARVITFPTAGDRLRLAHRFLVDASSRPFGRKLIGLKIEEQFASVREKLDRVQVDVPRLLADVKKLGDDSDADEALRLWTDLRQLALDVGDIAMARDAANQLVLVQLRRKDLAAVLGLWRDMEVCARVLKDSKTLAAVLHNQGELLRVLDDAAAAEAKSTEAEKLKREASAAEEALPREKIRAESVAQKGDWTRALESWVSVHRAATLVQNDLECYLALSQVATCELHLKRPVLQQEAAGGVNAPLTVHPLMEQAAAWETAGDPATAAACLARAAIAAHAAYSSSTEGSPEQMVVGRIRNHCFADLRRIGDGFAATDLAAAERMYSMLVDAVQQCLETSDGDIPLRLTALCNLDELGYTILKVGDGRVAEARAYMQKALAMLDEVDRADPSEREARAPLRKEIEEHIRSAAAS